MEFLGDAGGLYESLYLIGACLNFLFKGKSVALELLQSHFVVNITSFDSLNLE